MILNFSVKAQERTNYNQSTSSRIDHVLYKAIGNNKGITILNSKKKIVFNLNFETYDVPGSFANFDFVDFNHDGYKDLLIDYLTNVPDIQTLALYDKKTETFKLVKNFEKFPASIRLPNSNLYYSFHRSGCADYNWDSDLFKIVNFRAVKIGNISGLGCDQDKTQGVFIYQIIGNKEVLLKKYPISIIERYKNWKWGFIRYYWIHNYSKFL